MMTYTDDIAVIELKNDDEKAFEWIYQKYHHPLRIHAQKMVRCIEIATDIVHDIFEELWKKRKKRRITSLQAYLYACVRNRCINYLISAWVKNTQGIDDNKDFLEADEDNNPFFKLENEEKRKLLRKTIKALPDIYRKTIVLRYYKKLKIKQIAKLLKLTEEAVESRIRRGIAMLKESYKIL